MTTGQNLIKELSPEAKDQLSRYRKLLLEANRKINLISPYQAEQLSWKLIEESLAPLSVAELHLSGPFLDLGSGGGFPAIPLKIAQPEISMVLVESRRKKVLFLKWVIKELGLNDIEVIWGRWEDVISGYGVKTKKEGGPPQSKRIILPYDVFQVITSRAAGIGSANLSWLSKLLSDKGIIILWGGEKLSYNLDTLDDAEWQRKYFPIERGVLVIFQKVG